MYHPLQYENVFDNLFKFNILKGWRPLPYMSTYPASKAGLSFFSDSLADEFYKTKIRIQVNKLIFF